MPKISFILIIWPVKGSETERQILIMILDVKHELISIKPVLRYGNS